MTSQPYLSQEIKLVPSQQVSKHIYFGPWATMATHFLFIYYFTFYLFFKCQLLFYYIFIERIRDIFVVVEFLKEILVIK
jgi:hypothetical protein